MVGQALRAAAGGEQVGGSFADEERLLPLFTDPDARGERTWSEMFDPALCDEVDARDIIAQMPSLF